MKGTKITELATLRPLTRLRLISYSSFNFHHLGFTFLKAKWLKFSLQIYDRAYWYRVTGTLTWVLKKYLGSTWKYICQCCPSHLCHRWQTCDDPPADYSQSTSQLFPAHSQRLHDNPMSIGTSHLHWTSIQCWDLMSSDEAWQRSWL